MDHIFRNSCFKQRERQIERFKMLMLLGWKVISLKQRKGASKGGRPSQEDTYANYFGPCTSSTFPGLPKVCPPGKM